MIEKLKTVCSIPYRDDYSLQLNTMVAICRVCFFALTASSLFWFFNGRLSAALFVFALAAACGVFSCIIGRFPKWQPHAAVVGAILFGDVCLPMAFLLFGGVNVGMSAYFVLSIVLIFTFGNRRTIAILLTVHIAIIVLLYTHSYLEGALVLDAPPLDYYEGKLQSLLLAGFIIGIVALIVNKVHAEAKRCTEIAGKAKGDFISNMSHEMRTPMNAIIGLAHMAQESRDSVERMEYLVKIDEATEHLLGVIDDGLDISKIETGELTLACEDFELSKALEQVRAVTETHMTEQGIAFSQDIAPDVPDALHGDEKRLRQVILNLLSNATKFTPPGGSIRLSCTYEAGEGEEPGLVRVSVADTGIGISKQQQAHLFESFVQANDSVVGKYGGTGLGLAISKRIVGLMGGTFQLESAPGKGSTFTFTFRADPAKPAGGHDGGHGLTGDVPDFSGMHVLLAEDVDINAEIFSGILEPTGVRIDFAHNGCEALDRWVQDPARYDAIFMDIQMPEMDGYEATRRIRSHPAPEGKRVPIFALTANVFQEDVEHCLEAGMDAHIGKPFQPGAVFEALKGIAGKKKSAPTA
ncbi:MAG: response regulator [Clostridiales Family XIII bacterium]|nr:response regulator [Clostridiales Family XIII bacterium]